MTNLEQLRAAHALRQARALDRNDVQKMPALIINNGLLAATAFTLDSDPRAGMKRVMNAVAGHLAERKLIAPNRTNAKGIIEDLAATGRDPLALQRATTETLAYLGYLKRFAAAREKGDETQAGESRIAQPDAPASPTT